MKLSTTLGSLLCAGFVSAQYFSAGWSPGQAQEETQTSATFSPESESWQDSTQASLSKITSLFNLTRILSSEPVVSVLSRLGVNITERLQEVKANAPFWDDRIPLITDDNYGDVIVNEALTTEEEGQRMWFLVVSGTATGQEGLSKYLDEVFDSAYNVTELEGGLPGVRWGRIDYLNVTAITTKWALWQVPYLVFVTDRGKTLRFLRGTQLRLDPESMRTYLKTESWKSLEPWSTAYSPGGSREWIMELLAVVFTKVYNATVKIPRWLFLVLSGCIATLILGFLHHNPQKPAVVAKKPSPIADANPMPAQTVKRAGTRQRKAGKK